MMYDPTEDIYHLMYQWHPHHIDWGMYCFDRPTTKLTFTRQYLLGVNGQLWQTDIC